MSRNDIERNAIGAANLEMRTAGWLEAFVVPMAEAFSQDRGRMLAVFEETVLPLSREWKGESE